MMKAIVIHAYGGPEVLRYEDCPDPVAGPGEVLVRVAASSVNPFDFKVRSGAMKDFIPLRTETQKRATVLQAAIKRKAPPPELCGLFRGFTEAEGKVLKYISENQQWCNIPPQAVTDMKANHAKTMQTRDKVCSMPAQARPSGPAP